MAGAPSSFQFNHLLCQSKLFRPKFSFAPNPVDFLAIVHPRAMLAKEFVNRLLPRLLYSFCVAGH